MSTAHLPDAPTSTRLDITQNHETFLGAPIGEIQGAYPNAYPLPGSFPPWDATIPAFDSDVCNMDDDFNYYFPNCQGSSTMHPPAGFTPAMENPSPPMNHTYSQAASFYDLPVGNATNTAAVLPSEVVGHHEVPFPSTFEPFTFEHPLPTQPEAPPVQGQQQVQDAQGGPPAMEPLPEPGEVHNEDDQTYEESRATLVEPETHLNNISSNPPAPNTAVHFCSDNPKSTCSGNGTIDFDILLAFVAEYPDGLSVIEKAVEHFDSATAPGSNDGQSTGQLSQADTNDPLSPPHGVARCEMTSSDSSTVASTSTPAHSSPSGSCPISPKQFEAAFEPSESTRTDGSSTGKRRRSEDDLEDRSKIRRREQSMDVQENLKEDGEPCNTEEGGEKRRKKRKPIDGEYICLICKIFEQRCFPLSRRDSLKRHIARLHEFFQILLLPEFDAFKILEPRQNDQDENLFPLTLFCIAVQMEARARGVEIKAEQDLMLKYPDVVQSLGPLQS
ncbi:hypothetical protein JVT61DRAFT_10526 [Boletus reticuloceps]|uniref:Uncharacterized protein n=1 Tax=Boletus reticuloceps TaxID=495285 RepID=A0A8I3AC69_9AGAM|nr:hypothetical protein JVT61DRAFT_10526 [Boletus reticuloceps]